MCINSTNRNDNVIKKIKLNDLVLLCKRKRENRFFLTFIIRFCSLSVIFASQAIKPFFSVFFEFYTQN